MVLLQRSSTRTNLPRRAAASVPSSGAASVSPAPSRSIPALTTTVAATGNPYATMTGMWSPHEATGEQKTVYRYGVELEGWPAGTTLESPGHISDLRALDRLHAGFERGAIGFRVLSARKVARRERVLGIAHDESRHSRNDCQVRHLRPVETRSKILRNGTGIKTAEWITEEEDAA